LKLASYYALFALWLNSSFYASYRVLLHGSAVFASLGKPLSASLRLCLGKGFSPLRIRKSCVLTLCGLESETILPSSCMTISVLMVWRFFLPE